ncbi:hypothetical protein FGB62_37g34 [Gracilaria domingensis]|nr:hypothetical protein FGB62_37g34 [Gracilaria domingensis]
MYVRWLNSDGVALQQNVISVVLSATHCLRDSKFEYRPVPGSHANSEVVTALHLHHQLRLIMAQTTVTGPPQPPPRTVRQEVAPKGGYARINVARNVPKTIGTGAGPLLFGTALLMGYGMYRVGSFNVKRRELRQEKKNIRLAIIPFLQAEEDARFVKKRFSQVSNCCHLRHWLTRQRDEYNIWEASVMKDVPGWKVGENVYQTRKFMPPVGGEPPFTHN